MDNLQNNPPVNPTENISEFKPPKGSKLKVVLIVIFSIIITVGLAIALNYFMLANSEYPHAHLCQKASDCAEYCMQGEPLCTVKPEKENSNQSIIELVQAGELNLIDYIIPNQKYCACLVTTQ